MTDKIRMASGVVRLDRLLNGLYIGDNVVWHDDAGSLAWIFCLNFLKASQAEAKPIIYVSFDRSPKSLLEKLGPLAENPKMTILDCFTCGKGASSPVFMKFYSDKKAQLPCRVINVDQPNDMLQVSDILYNLHAGLSGDVRLVFESLTGMQELWGGEEELINFYSHACPRLYELETIAYWIMEKKAHSSRLKARITQIAQVVIELSIKRGTTSLTIHKAENRETKNVQKPFTYWTRDGAVTFDEEKRTAGGLDLGRRVKTMRAKKGLSQTELAKLVGVTPSTISQVESDLIYPSLPAMIKMAEVLNVDVGSFFQESPGSKARFIFSPEDAQKVKGSALPEKSVQAQRLTPIDFNGKVEPYLIEIAPGHALASHFFFYKGEEFGYLMSGRLEIAQGSEVYFLEPGNLIYLTSEAPDRWKNIGSEPARLLWLKII